jgi:hypothetical protein
MKSFFTLALCFCFVFICPITKGRAITYNEIDAACKSMTDAQFDNYKKTLVGTSVTWTGVITDVTKNWGQDYGVRIDMDNTGVADVYFDVPEAVALSLRKKGSYTFSGTIKSVQKIFGGSTITLDKASIR